MSLINYCALTQTWHTWPTSAIWHFPFLAPRDQILRFPKVDETMMKHRSTWILDHYLRNMWMIHFWIYILEISISTFLDHSPWGCSLLCKDSWRICCCFYAVPVDNTSAWLGSFYQHLSVEMKGLWKGCVSSSQLQFLYPRWYTCAFDPLRWSSDVPVCCFFRQSGSHVFSCFFSHLWQTICRIISAVAQRLGPHWHFPSLQSLAQFFSFQVKTVKPWPLGKKQQRCLEAN